MEKQMQVIPDGTPRYTRIKHALRLRGITQREVAQKQGITAIHVSKVLNGKRQSNRLLNFCEELVREHDITEAA